jgi:hypothetical protein
MTDLSRRTDSRGAHRSRRRATALVAQYIHEISGRHDRARRHRRRERLPQRDGHFAELGKDPTTSSELPVAQASGAGAP